VVMPEPAASETYPQPTDALREALVRFFDARRTLTTRTHVVGPVYVEIGIAASLALQADAPPADALDAARQALATYFDPLSGGPDRRGWPFGRDVYVSEIYAVLEDVSLVNYIEEVRISGPRPIVDENGDIIGVQLDVHELVKLQPPRLVAYDVYGKQYS